jgi:hypothetical protein
MKRILKQRGTSYNTYEVHLETDEERSWCDSRLITATDRSNGLTNEEWQLIQSGEQHPGHFGGSVQKLPLDVRLVKVYVD